MEEDWQDLVRRQTAIELRPSLDALVTECVGYVQASMPELDSDLELADGLHVSAWDTSTASSWALSAQEEQRILQARAKTNWGPMRLAALTGRHRATVWKVLKRHGQSKRRRAQRQAFRRFEWSQPGALLHIDAYKAPKFASPGHRVCPIFCVWSGVTDRPVGAGKDIHDRHRWRRTV